MHPSYQQAFALFSLPHLKHSAAIKWVLTCSYCLFGLMGWSFPPSFDFEYDVTHVLRANDGSIHINPLNGTGPYQVQWLDANYNSIGNQLSLTGLSEGVYYLVLTDSGSPSSNNEIYTYFWLGKYGATTTLSAQPDGRFGKDAAVKYAANPTYTSVNTRNFGTTDNLDIYTGTNGGQINHGRAFLAFQYYGLATATIEEAKLSLHGWRHRNQPQNNRNIQNEVYVRKVTQSWQEDQITWNNQAGNLGTSGVQLPAAGANNSFIITQPYLREAIITAYVKDHLEQQSPNYGLCLELVEEGVYRTQTFYSSDYTTPQKRPTLTVTFTVPVLPFFTQTKPRVDGSYLKVGTDRELRFAYTEAYNDQDNRLTYTIYNDQHQVIMTEADQAISTRYGNNRLALDINCCLDCNRFYILKIINKKNEQQYLRFKTAPWPDDGSGTTPAGPHPCFSGGSAD